MGRKKQPRRKRGTGQINYDKTTGQYVARTADGRRSGRYPDRQSAEAALDTWNSQIAKGIDLGKSGMPMGEYLQLWMVEGAAPRVKRGTLLFYKRHLEYTLPHIGTIALDQLNRVQIQRMTNALARSGLAPRSVAHVVSVLHNALESAILWDLILVNPATRISLPKTEGGKGRALQPGEVARLLAACEGDRLEALYHLTITLGLRRGEALGLRWIDLDRDRGLITISQQIVTVGSKVEVSSPKTEESKRLLPLTSALLEMLQTQWGRLQEERRSPGWVEYGLIFPSVRGTPIAPRNLTRAFKALLGRAGLDTAIRFHDLRHTALTTLAGVADPKTVQAIAGHADVETTMGIYAHVRAEALRPAVEAAEKARKRG